MWQYAAPGFTNAILDETITKLEIELALKTLKDGKAAGTNAIPSEFYKYATEHFKESLAFVFNRVMDGELFPDEFRDSIICPIHKKGSLLDPANYRGISFLNASYKIFTTVLHKRLTAWIASNKLLKEFQAGFRNGYSTIDNIFVLKSLAENFLSQGKKLYVFFIDFKAAFDSIDRGALFYKLYSLGMSLKFGSVLEKAYRNTRAAVWNGNELSEWFATTSGVRQGCTLSPTLFALFLDDLIDYLPGGVLFAGVQIKALLFADDVVMFAYSPGALQLMINKVFEYSQLWNLFVNIQKSKVMIFKRGGGSQAANERWFFNRESIEIVKEYKYLGLTFTNSLNMQKNFNDKLQKAKTAINISWKSCFRNVNISHSSKYKIFESVSETILLYGAQAWGCKRFDSVEKLLIYFIKRVFQLPLSTPNYVVMLETGISPLFIKTLKLQADYLIKVLRMPDFRLVKKAVLKSIQDRSSWYGEWLRLAERCNMTLVLNGDDLPASRTNLYEIISKLDEQCRAEYELEAAESLFRSTYSRLSHNRPGNNYFCDSNSIQMISMMVKLRGEMLDLNYIPHRPDLPLECSLCNLKEREDVIHFVGKCPVLSETRRSVFGSNFLSEEAVLRELNEMDVKKLYEYCKIALRYRQRIVNEDL